MSDAPPGAGFEGLSNAVVAERLEAFAALLELADASPYSARAYRRAAELVGSLEAPVAELVRAGRVRELRGIGPGIEARLRELVETGTIAELDELERTVSPALVGLGRLIGVGPERMVEVGRSLGIRTAEELRDAARSGRLAAVPGIGPKTEARISEALERPLPPPARSALLLNRSGPLVEQIATALGGEPAGDPRRWCDASERLCVVCAADDPAPIVERFEALREIVALVGSEDRRATGVTVEGVPVELVVAEPSRFGTELVAATGSQAYVEALGPLPDAPDEEALYQALGLPWCPPELREEPFRDEPPPLLDLGDVRGDLHCHTTWSDGRASVREMAESARDRGYEYLAICDHTPNVGVVPGLDASALRRQGEEIAVANEGLAPFRVLRGAECDIRADGELDLPDEVLAELDWVQLSLHAGQRRPGAELTRIVTNAMRHPAVRCLSHPTGRLIGRRPPNAVDLDAVFATALETGVTVEVNGLPDRLDLSGENVRRAREAGVPIVVSTDAHSPRGLGNMLLAVATARRGWAGAGDVLNTRALADVLAHRRT